jgi:hypothetical protein
MDDHPRGDVLHPRLVLGLAILALGALLALESLNVFHLNIRWSEYWPVILIVLGLSKILQPRRRHRNGGGFILLFLGCWFLARNLTGHDLDRFFFPLLLLVVGGSLVFCSFGRRRGFAGPATSSGLSPGADGSAASLHPFAILGGARATSSSQEFLGGSATALLGSSIVDLRQAAIPAGQEAVIDATAFWGGVVILVPETWSVVLQGMPILGSFQDFTQAPPGGSTQRLVVRGIAIMGSVEARNRTEREDGR